MPINWLKSFEIPEQVCPGMEPLSPSTGSMELLDDIEQDLVSSSLSSQPSVSIRGPTRLRSAFLHDLRRPACAPPASPWSRSRDSGAPLSGSCSSACVGLQGVVEGLQARLQERDETLRALRENYVTLLESHASLKNVLDQARLCTACTSRRQLVDSRTVNTTSHHTVSDNTKSPASPALGNHLPPDASRQSLEEMDLHDVSGDTSASCQTLSSRSASVVVENLPAVEENSLTRNATRLGGETGSQPGSSRNIMLKDEVARDLLLCCLDAAHMAARNALERSEAIRGALLALSPSDCQQAGKPKPCPYTCSQMTRVLQEDRATC